MPQKKSSFKQPPKKYQPKGLSVLYEDHDILVVDKIGGLLTIGTNRERDKTAQALLNTYVKKGNQRSKNRVFIVHRLDRDTSGVLLFAKTEKAKHYLQDNWQEFEKKYYAVVIGKLLDKEGIITSYLAENKIYRMYSVNDPKKGKLAKTGYKVIKESKKFSLLEINLFTGRKNQIRVHLAEKGHPVAGDKVYGESKKTGMYLALHATSLTISHPFTHKKMVFESPTPPHFKKLV